MLKVKLLDIGPPKTVLRLALQPPDSDDIERTVLLLKQVRKTSRCDSLKISFVKIKKIYLHVAQLCAWISSELQFCMFIKMGFHKFSLKCLLKEGKTNFRQKKVSKITRPTF